MKEFKGISSKVKIGEYIQGKQKYIIDEEIVGGANHTYKAIANGKVVFVKQYKIPYNNPKAKEIYKIQQKLKPYLSKLSFSENNLDDFVFNGYYFQIKEYLSSKNIDDLLFNDKINFKNRIEIVFEVVNRVYDIHSIGIIHTDLKPEQFLYHNGHLYLIDFDYIILPKEKIYRPASTKGWRSPEHIEKENITFKSDIFSLGMLLYYIFSKRHPFNNTDGIDMLNSYIPLNKLLKSFPTIISDFITDMLAFNADYRPNIFEVKEFFDETLYKAFSKPKILNSSNIKLTYNEKEYIVFADKIITRNICKTIFKNHKNIYKEQFKLTKKSDGWYIKGLKVKEGINYLKNGQKVIYFPTLLNGENITDIEKPLKNGDKIQVDDVEFIIKE